MRTSGILFVVRYLGLGGRASAWDMLEIRFIADCMVFGEWLQLEKKVDISLALVLKSSSSLQRRRRRSNSENGIGVMHLEL